ncbi:MAG: NAD(+) synthase, partial [Kiritimatiellae bacterium]|nr:NAD(+) synthase [Kiritimatiellia bacterium]
MLKAFGFCRICAASPPVAPTAVADNVSALVDSALDAAESGADICVFPELCVTGYTCGDLFYHASLLDAAEAGLASFLAATRARVTLFVVGLPLRLDGLLINGAAACCQGRIIGVVPKSCLPNTQEFYERRWFASGIGLAAQQIRVCGAYLPLGTGLLFESASDPACRVGIEVCEDLWSPQPPSQALAVGGATIICNLSASNERVGKADYRRMLVAAQSARCLAAYAYAGAGVGESTTDLVFGGHTLLAENGRVLAEGERFVRKGTRVLADVDLAFLLHERRQNAVFADCSAHTAPLRRLTFGDGTVVERAEHPCVTELIRVVDPHPFVPSDRVSRDERCAEVFAIQSSGLATRLLHAGIKAVVVGVSGGLDSALALLAAYEAFDRAGLDRSGVHAVTMPGFGTTALTLDNARRLCEGLGVALEQIDITQACRQHLADLGHDGESHDITFENAQARERTQVLMDRANMLHALVVGSGDLSELALGWCTFNGDQ